MEAQLAVALQKEDGGVRPLEIKEVLRRLAAKILLSKTGIEAENCCGIMNLSAGQRAGVEAAAAHMKQIWMDASDDEVIVLCDADNAFNRLKKGVALWTARILWPSAARFLHNIYQGEILVILWGI